MQTAGRVKGVREGILGSGATAAHATVLPAARQGSPQLRASGPRARVAGRLPHVGLDARAATTAGPRLPRRGAHARLPGLSARRRLPLG